MKTFAANGAKPEGYNARTLFGRLRAQLKLDQGALGMSDPSPVSHQQGDQAIRNTRFIRGHQKQRRICSASPAVHHLQCFSCSALPTVHQLRCITSSASDAVHHLRCITCSASSAVHHLQCITCDALHLQSIT